MTAPMEQPTPVVVPPDSKDWTWVLERACPECGYDSAAIVPGRLGALLRENSAAWGVALARPGVRRRPAATVWSPLEYACHVRDVNRVFAERLELMLNEDAPEFANWDQDATAIRERYDLQDPGTVADELADAAAIAADLYDDVPDDAWGRRGLRSNGSEFTVESLGRYHLHDVVHHLHDIGGAAT